MDTVSLGVSLPKGLCTTFASCVVRKARNLCGSDRLGLTAMGSCLENSFTSLSLVVSLTSWFGEFSACA